MLNACQFQGTKKRQKLGTLRRKCGQNLENSVKTPGLSTGSCGITGGTAR